MWNPADIVSRVRGERAAAIAHIDLAGGFTRSAGHQLHQSARAGMADGGAVKLAFLPRNCMNHRPVLAVA